MKVLIKNATIVDPNSEWNSKQADLLIDDGIISKIADSINDKTAKTVEATNLHVSPGWFDLHVNFREPGDEYKEDLLSGVDAAISGGFTGVALMPSTNPAICNKSAIEYVINKTKHTPVDVLPCGTISDNRAGKNLAEMYDMKQAGAAAFTDDKRSIADAGLMSRALLYTKSFNALIMNFPCDYSTQPNGMMNEGIVSTQLGVEGIPSLAEELQITRDLYLTEYNDSKIHLSTISSPRGLDLIAEAKEGGIAVSCDIAIHNLVLNDESVRSFDSNFKVLPPLRSEEERQALIEGLKDGTIDVICSDHSPEDVEHKNVEFGQANYGIIGLETLFGLAVTHLSNELTLDELINKISINPRSILQVDIPMVKEGFEANLTLFDPAKEWTYSVENCKSKSKNTPFDGIELVGKPLGIFNNKQLALID
jgi:dihydroorotase